MFCYNVDTVGHRFTTRAETQYIDSVSSDGIPVLASDTEKSVIFVAEKLSPSVQWPHIIVRATQVLPTFSSSCSDSSSSIGK